MRHEGEKKENLRKGGARKLNGTCTNRQLRIRRSCIAIHRIARKNVGTMNQGTTFMRSFEKNEEDENGDAPQLKVYINVY